MVKIDCVTIIVSRVLFLGRRVRNRLFKVPCNSANLKYHNKIIFFFCKLHYIKILTNSDSTFVHNNIASVFLYHDTYCLNDRKNMINNTNI